MKNPVNWLAWALVVSMLVAGLVLSCCTQKVTEPVKSPPDTTDKR